MKPIRIRLKGFRSFRDDRPGEATFEGVSAIAIVGDTGAGKSSILEALTWGLYGRTSQGAQVIQHLMHDHARKMQVDLEIEAEGTRYRIVRSARRTKAGDVMGDGAVVTALETSGVPDRIVAEGVTATLKSVEEIVGLDADAFQRTTVLPQGRFARLLAEDDQKVRAAVLRQIWPADEIEAAHLELRQAHVKAQALKDLADHERGNHPADGAAHARTLEGETEARKRDLYRATSRQTAAAEGAARWRDANSKRAAYEIEAKTADRLATQLDEHARELENASTTASALTKTRQNAYETAEAHRAAAERAAADGSPMDVLTATTAIRAMRERRRDVPAARRTAADAGHESEAARSATTGLRDTAIHAAALEDNAATTAANAGEAAAEATRTAHAAKHAANTATSTAQSLLKRIERDETTSRDEIRAAERALAEANANTEKTQHEQQTAETDARTAADQLDEARRMAAAAAAAALHQPGDACPVCQKTLDDSWTAPEAPALDRAVADEREARRTADTRRTASTTTAALQDRARERRRMAIDAAAARTRSAADDAAAGIRALGSALPPGVQPPANDARGWTDLLAKAARTLAADAAVHQEDARNLAEHAAAAARTLRSTAAERAAAEAAFNAAGERVARERATENAARQTLAAIETRATDATAAARKAVAALKPGDTSETLTQIGRGPDLRANEIEEELDRIDAAARETAALETQASRASEAAAAAGDRERRHAAERMEPARAALEAGTARVIALEEKASVRGDEAGRNSADRARHTAGALRRLAHEARADADRAAADTAAAAGLDAAEASAPTTLAEELGHAKDRAAGDLQAAETRRAAFEVQRHSIAALDELAHEVADVADQLAEGRSALGAGAFPKHITLRRSARLLAHAGTHLRRMTRNRYSFLDPRDTQERWRVLDAHTGQSRDPGQLSGGEQFLASLALALGTVEALGRTGAKVRTLCIDEGFGSLDQQTLQQAVTGLREAAGDQHLIVLVSHVREVAEAVDDIMIVDKDEGGGSRIRQLVGQEKAEYLNPEQATGGSTLLGAA